MERKPLFRVQPDRRQMILLVGIFALLIAGCSLAPKGGNSEPGTLTPVQKGQKLFESGGKTGIPCANCHTLDGTKLVGPSLQGLAERAGQRVPGLSAEAYIRQSITTPSTFIVPEFATAEAMPPVYSYSFSETMIDNLTAFLMSLE